MKIHAPKHDSVVYMIGLVLIVVLNSPIVLLSIGLLLGHFLTVTYIIAIIIVMGVGYIL